MRNSDPCLCPQRFSFHSRRSIPRRYPGRKAAPARRAASSTRSPRASSPRGPCVEESEVHGQQHDHDNRKNAHQCQSICVARYEGYPSARGLLLAIRALQDDLFPNLVPPGAKPERRVRRSKILMTSNHDEGAYLRNTPFKGKGERKFFNDPALNPDTKTRNDPRYSNCARCSKGNSATRQPASKNHGLWAGCQFRRPVVEEVRSLDQAETPEQSCSRRLEPRRQQSKVDFGANFFAMQPPKEARALAED